MNSKSPPPPLEPWYDDLGATIDKINADEKAWREWEEEQELIIRAEIADSLRLPRSIMYQHGLVGTEMLSDRFLDEYGLRRGKDNSLSPPDEQGGPFDYEW